MYSGWGEGDGDIGTRERRGEKEGETWKGRGAREMGKNRLGKEKGACGRGQVEGEMREGRRRRGERKMKRGRRKG
jgi:hypothetical protein